MEPGWSQVTMLGPDTSDQGEYTGGQAKAWIYSANLLQPITAKYYQATTNNVKQMSSLVGIM